MNEEFLKYISTFPLIPEGELIAPCSSSKGVQGHGEGMTYGKSVFKALLDSGADIF
jgi:hypothetical protein